MSVSIALLPVALVMRLVMGKEGFDNFVKAQQWRIPTRFSSREDLSLAVKKAGFDVIAFGSFLKTHFQGKNFMFWECVGGKWEAVFSISDDKEIIQSFLKKVGASADSQVLSAVTQTKLAAASFPTNFRDGALLHTALHDFGANPVRNSDGSIRCKLGQSVLRFNRYGDQPFTVEISNAPSLEQVYQHLSDIDEDYKRCVQTAVYEKVKARADTQGLMLESEEVLEDRTILLTLRVR
ncbi:hypothetical protein AGMMS50256_09330 [Betaproteobacteria bacterium]|nr:hypothetical protein AGMMS50256_09330 [Betaproteobacteria bacterium]